MAQEKIEEKIEEKIFEVAPGEKYVDDRSRLTVFFQVLGRKFWKLISVNFMFVLFNLPAIIISFILGIYMMELFFPKLVEAAGQTDLITILFVFALPLVMFLMAVPIITVGPAQAGLTYLLRCFSYELPTFLWSDFKDKMKQNIKQGIIVSLINLFGIVFLLFDLYLYTQLNVASSVIFPIANGLLIVVLIIFLMMNLYIYPMMVTYDLKIKNLYKNAFLFAFAKFLPNLAILIICLILIVGPSLLIQLTGNVLVLAIMYVFYLILGFTLPGLIINFFINPVIDKYLQPAPKDAE